MWITLKKDKADKFFVDTENISCIFIDENVVNKEKRIAVQLKHNDIAFFVPITAYNLKTIKGLVKDSSND